MKIYLVGGAVRDKIMGVPPCDKDYVVTGSSIEKMLQAGYLPVGKGFPVFIKKGSDCEYALARKEIKIGPLHTDFKFIFDESVTLKEDLFRRDFTCNAVAYDEETGEYIDYYGGIQDIKNHILRHVSEHFVEDPLRVVRLCRFTAQLDFMVAPETMKLAQEMARSDQLKYLTAERIWGEVQRALQYPHFYRFIETAQECGALKSILSSAEEYWFTKAENDSSERTLAEYVISQLKNVQNESDMVKFATLLSAIGREAELSEKKISAFDDKASAEKDDIGNGENNKDQGEEVIKQICKALKVPNDFRKFALFAYKNQPLFPEIPTMDAEDLVDLMDAFIKRTPDQLEDFIAVCRTTLLSDDDADDDSFEDIERKMRDVFEILSSIKASSMPDFDKIEKDATFGEKYKQFKLKIMKEHGYN